MTRLRSSSTLFSSSPAALTRLLFCLLLFLSSAAACTGRSDAPPRLAAGVFAADDNIVIESELNEGFRRTAKPGMGLYSDQVLTVPNGARIVLEDAGTRFHLLGPGRYVLRNLSRLYSSSGKERQVRHIEESLLKTVRSLEVGVNHLYLEKFNDYGYEELMEYIKNGTDDRIYAIAELLWHGGDLGLICDATKIDMIFLEKIKNIIDMENALRETPFDAEALYKAKKMGFSDKYVAKLWNCAEAEVFALREKENIFPVYKMIDSCAGEFESYIPYFYSCYEDENESIVTDKPKIVVLGSGPIRIGQGVEFDYSTVHAVRTIREMGYEAIIINNNPETVSTDYSVSDKLYFEPLFIEDVMNVIRHEQPLGVIATLGGQTAINLAEPLAARGVKLIGTDVKAIDLAEDRDLFENLLRELGIPEPPGAAVTHIEDGVKVAAAIGYPVLVRPSFVLGGR